MKLAGIKKVHELESWTLISELANRLLYKFSKNGNPALYHLIKLKIDLCA